MSYISTVYDQILTKLAEIYPTSEKTRLFDPYSLGDNPVHVLRDGYGLRKGPTLFGEAEFHSFRDDHTFTVVLTREVVRHSSEVTTVDTGVKQLLEDAFELRERFYRVDKLGLSSEIENITLGPVGGVEQFLTGQQGRFFSVTVDFTVQVREILQ